MEMKLYVIAFYTLSQLAWASVSWSMEGTFGPRRLFILFDPHGQETSQTGSFALMSELVAGVEQQAAPLLVSESLWHNFVTRRHRYQQLKDNGPLGGNLLTDLLKKYATTIIGPQYDYRKDILTFRNKLNQLYAAHYGYFEQALKTFGNQPPSTDFNDFFKTIAIHEKELQQDHPIRKEINFDFIAYTTRFNPLDWTIRHIPNFAYLLVPNSYEQQVTKQVNTNNLPSFQNISNRELILGLKIDHMPTITDPLTPPKESVSAQQANISEKIDLRQLFVTRQDLGLIAPSSKIKAPESHENYLGMWNVYATGHGWPDRTLYYQEKIAQNEQELAQAKKKLKETQNQLATYQKEQETIEKKWREAKIGSTQEKYYAKSKESIFATILSSQKAVSAYQELVKALQDQVNKLKQKIATGDTGASIAGLSVDNFKEVLNFFNSFVKTGLFFYNTCFGSGKNLEAPYQYENMPLNYNYTLVSGASVDAPTTVKIPEIGVSPATPTAIALELRIQFNQDFTKYFTELEAFQAGKSTPSLADILNNIHKFKSPWTLDKMQNIPLVRFPNTEWFRVVDMPKTKVFGSKLGPLTATITEQSAITHLASNTPFTIQGQNALLLYTEHIPVPVKIMKDRMPAVLSMIGGNADHYFEEISAPKIPLSEVVQKFMPIQKQEFTKRFFIKRLTCLVDKNPKYEGLIKNLKGFEITLDNVVIINNDTKLFTSDSTKKVNVVLFIHTFKSQNIPHQALWPATDTISSGNIPNLTFFSSNDPKAGQLINTIEKLFSTASKPPVKRTEQLAGRKKIQTFLQEKAVPVLQKYKTLQETNPQGIAAWLTSLTPDERKIISIIHPSETTTPTPTLTKTEFEAWQKTIEKESKPRIQTPPLSGVKPQNTLVNSLQQLQINLRNLEQRLR
ncbi:MAG: PspA/IM30 family protein [Candidatus Babeliales bacterium]